MANNKKTGKGKKAKSQTMVARPIGGQANPANQQLIRRAGAPKITYRENGVIVQNTEKFRGVASDVGGSTKIQEVWCMNPASFDVFPWLANLTRGYSRYRFRKLHLSWAPHVGTTVSGVVAAASAYDAEDAVAYAVNFGGGGTSLTNTSSQAEFCEGPPYAGGSLSSSVSSVSGINHLGIAFDTSRMNDAQKWFIVDPAWAQIVGSTTDYARINQTVPCFALLQYRNGTTVELELGSWYVSYEIELVHPTNPAITN
jgi:hypothetical protein